MKVDFTKIEVQVSFDGTKQTLNLAKRIGNDMMFNSSVICDIGFEELARQIYFSDGEVDVPIEYVRPLLQVLADCRYIACVRRYLTKKLNG